MDAYFSNKMEEVSDLVSCYIVRQIIEKSEFEECKDILNSKENHDLQKKILTRGILRGLSSSF